MYIYYICIYIHVYCIIEIDQKYTNIIIMLKKYPYLLSAVLVTFEAIVRIKEPFVFSSIVITVLRKNSNTCKNIVRKLLHK